MGATGHGWLLYFAAVQPGSEGTTQDADRAPRSYGHPVSRLLLLPVRLSPRAPRGTCCRDDATLRPPWLRLQGDSALTALSRSNLAGPRLGVIAALTCCDGPSLFAVVRCGCHAVSHSSARLCLGRRWTGWEPKTLATIGRHSRTAPPPSRSLSAPAGGMSLLWCLVSTHGYRPCPHVGARRRSPPERAEGRSGGGAEPWSAPGGAECSRGLNP